MTNAPAAKAPRMVLAPSWAMEQGAWRGLSGGWPGEVEVYLGAGLGDRPGREDWDPEQDVAELAALSDHETVLCAAGWTSELVLRAAARRRPRAVLLWMPPTGADFADVVGQGPEAAFDFITTLNPCPDWAAWRLRPGLTARARHYLLQDVVAATVALGDLPVLVAPAELAPAGPSVVVVEGHNPRAFSRAAAKLLSP